MLTSMTGFGEARSIEGRVDIAAEIRSLNNRYLKVTVKCPDSHSVLEPEIERLVRGAVRRGTVTVTVRISMEPSPEDFRLNTAAIESYWQQLKSLESKTGASVSLGHLLALPGAVSENAAAARDPRQDWPLVRKLVAESLTKLGQMRRLEGEAMAEQLRQCCQTIQRHLAEVAELAPQVAENYRRRLHERVKAALAELDIEVNQADLIKEVAIFAERSDITEEIVRLRSHVEQFLEVMDEAESNGRKLEFLSQEMFREANTIGSKASDVAIGRHTVEIKSAVEKIRELAQNIE